TGSLRKHLLRQGLAVTTFPPTPASIRSDSGSDYNDEYLLETPTKIRSVRKKPNREFYAICHVDDERGKRKKPRMGYQSNCGGKSNRERDEALDEAVTKLQGLIDHFANGKQPGRVMLWACGCQLFQVDAEAGPHHDVIQYWRRGDREAYMRSNSQYRERSIALAERFLNAFPRDVKRLRDLLKQRKENRDVDVCLVMNDRPKSRVPPKRDRILRNRNSAAGNTVVVVIPERRPPQGKTEVIVIRDETPNPSTPHLGQKKVDMQQNSPVILYQGVSPFNRDFIKARRATTDFDLELVTPPRGNTSILSTPKRKRCA
ncbi:hypothetical protein IWQ62_000974, partial [Dispira parvispora]